LAGSPILVTDSIHSLITTTEASTLFGVSCEAVRQWVRRGKLTATGIDDRGRKLYRLIDVSDAEKATRKRAGRAA
jgi:excisionase family DNA binding protein